MYNLFFSPIYITTIKKKKKKTTTFIFKFNVKLPSNQISIKRTIEVLSQNRLCDLSLTMIEKHYQFKYQITLSNVWLPIKYDFFLKKIYQWYSSNFSTTKTGFLIS